MKSLFKEFYFDNKNTDIWINSVIVLDTNILLNLYRYSKETSEKLFALLEKSKDRLWLPHQIALEFHLNRTNVILDQQTSYEKIESILRKKSSEIESSLKKELGSYRKKHVTLSIDSIIDQIKSSIDGLISEILKEKEDHPILLKNDHIKREITELFEDKVGSPYKQEKLKEIEKEADKRYALEIPPGYRDASKKGAKFHNGEIILEKYGDYILWQQIIDFAKEKQIDIIFITDDEKKDWWYECKGKTIGPRSELLNEFNYKTGMEFYMFKPEVFMKDAGDIYSESFSDNLISEVREVRSQYSLSLEGRFQELHEKEVNELKNYSKELSTKKLLAVLERNKTKFRLILQTEKQLNSDEIVGVLTDYFYKASITIEVIEVNVAKGYFNFDLVVTVNSAFNDYERLSIEEELMDQFFEKDIEPLILRIVFLN
ncbi:PIN-like domain-containing protein [Bacillus velezensis]|uniref:PIN-like domain-containing protein n=1 Tax=Bacillus velezensis TaxID=492670 RepID=UPI00255BE014|nr:PIN domain-containing protein [Bacillus velezensis]MDL5022656.1 PIN domain-containing protein [Bacillus velezensis]